MDRLQPIIDTQIDHHAAVETLLEDLLPLLIAASPAREQAQRLLETWASRETSQGEEVMLGNMAESILKRLPPPA